MMARLRPGAIRAFRVLASAAATVLWLAAPGHADPATDVQTVGFATLSASGFAQLDHPTNGATVVGPAIIAIGSATDHKVEFANNASGDATWDIAYRMQISRFRLSDGNSLVVAEKKSVNWPNAHQWAAMAGQVLTVPAGLSGNFSVAAADGSVDGEAFSDVVAETNFTTAYHAHNITVN